MSFIYQPFVSMESNVSEYYSLNGIFSVSLTNASC